MDDPRCAQFFRQPRQTQQRHYEALRAYFVEQRSLPDIARQFGLAHGTLRNLVARFRAQCLADHVPPFSSNHAEDDLLAAPPPAHDRRFPPLPMPGPWT